MRQLLTAIAVACLVPALTCVEAAVITDARRIVGNTPGQPEIVPGPSPEGLQEGSHSFMDRPLHAGDARNYHWVNIPEELVGADYVMTYNHDKNPSLGNAYDVSYSVTLGRSAMLYIFIDDRYVDAHGSSAFPWLTDGSSGTVFRDTGLDILLDELGGRNVLQRFHVYGARVPSGTYILGASCDGNSSRNFYAIAAVASPLIMSAERIGGVTPGEPEIVSGPSPGGLQEGSHAFMDRPLSTVGTRDYCWRNVPSELLGADYVMTYNDDKMSWDTYNDRQWPNNPYDVSYSVTLSRGARLYLFIDRRYVSVHGDPPFAWLTDGSCGAVFEDTGLEIMLDEFGGRNVLQPFSVYSADVPAGPYYFGPACDGDSNRNFYSIAAVFGGGEDFETGDFSVFDWEHGGVVPWEITSWEAHSGAYSARAGDIMEDEDSVLTLTVDCLGGAISFFVKTSSESNFDQLVFRIDGQVVGEWSGELNWTEVSYPVTADVHTFEWAYVKDESADEGDDTAWIDDIRVAAASHP